LEKKKKKNPKIQKLKKKKRLSLFNKIEKFQFGELCASQPSRKALPEWRGS
jgi:hypothetical protein